MCVCLYVASFETFGSGSFGGPLGGLEQLDQEEDYEARPRSAARKGSKDDYCDDPRRRWRNSLRPLDPGILSDVKNKKKERFGRANINQTKRLHLSFYYF